MIGRRTSRSRIRGLFLRLLGVVFLVAFLSLLAQVTLLFGSRGLLPAADYLRSTRGVVDAPTVFWIADGDGALRAAAIAGAVLSFGLILNVAPRYCLLLLWVLYLSFVTVGQEFFAFQWDNLLLESAFFSLFIAPGGLRPTRPPPPHPIAVFLMLWLVFRMHVESGAAKLLLGDPTWRDLTAMATYYETAPLPTWIGWWAHQMPLWGHRVTGGVVYLVELALPFLMWGPRTVRTAVFAAMVAMQIAILLTANYGFFNYLSIALALFVLDDTHLGVPVAVAADPPRRAAPLAVVAAVLVGLSAVQFLPLVPVARPFEAALLPVQRVLSTFRSINAYHLFAHMTLVRREAVIEGSEDGTTWLPYEFRYKPGDPDRAPPFVAPHQPRVDFQLWFLLLGPQPGARWFDALLDRLLSAPDVVAPLFARDPFPVTPPRFVRVAIYRYRFTDRATHAATGASWQRELQGYSRPRSAGALHGR
ncbi:MAG TPA: lipase maturation factor family protein [Candidatus Binatus sp.]|nr:lipase maturation factor family protein [Candidatus Binatus sp.]